MSIPAQKLKILCVYGKDYIRNPATCSCEKW